MKQMEEMILREGKALPGNVLKVGSFLNQKIDTRLLREISREVARLYANDNITKILTVESSGIAIATGVGLEMGVPVVFAKKHKTSNVDGSTFASTVHSYTHNMDYRMIVSRDYLCSRDRVLLVDDFLANGNALNGLMDLVSQAGAWLAGAAIAIEKGFQGGGDTLRSQGLRVESLAIIDSMEGGQIRFRP